MNISLYEIFFQIFNTFEAELVQLSEWYRKRMNFAPYEVRKYDSKCETVPFPTTDIHEEEPSKHERSTTKTGNNLSGLLYFQ